MKQIIATTLEQSKHLIESGVDENTADMAWNVFVDGSTRLLPKDDWDLTTEGGAVVIPAWSLEALMELLPICIGGEYYLFVDKDIYDNRVIRYGVFYATTDNVFNTLFNHTNRVCINAVYEMVVELKKCKKI